MWLFLLLLVLPLVEIALFVQIGGLLGLWPTLAIVILGTVFGLFVLRAQQWQAPAELREAVEQSRDPAAPLAHSALRMVGALLLLVPGFLTDTIGVLLLVPQVRFLVLRRILARVAVHRHPGDPHGARSGHGAPRHQRHRNSAGEVIEGEYEVHDPENAPHPRPTHGKGNNTRH